MNYEFLRGIPYSYILSRSTDDVIRVLNNSRRKKNVDFYLASGRWTSMLAPSSERANFLSWWYFLLSKEKRKEYMFALMIIINGEKLDRFNFYFLFYMWSMCLDLLRQNVPSCEYVWYRQFCTLRSLVWLLYCRLYSIDIRPVVLQLMRQEPNLWTE